MYVMLDALAHEGQSSGEVDVMATVQQVLQERAGTLRTVKQLRFIYTCLIEVCMA